MKRKLSAVFLIFNISFIFAQYEFTASVQNQSADGSAFTFDIYMLRTGSLDIYLGDCDFAFTFNNENFAAPSATVLTTDAQIWNWYAISAEIVPPDIIVLNLGKPNWNNQTQFNERIQIISTEGYGTLVARIQINNITEPSGDMGLLWQTAAQNTTKINRFDATDPWLQHSITEQGTYNSIAGASLPVELLSFTAQLEEKYILLQWQTQFELNNLGFFIERSLDAVNWQLVSTFQQDDALKARSNGSQVITYSILDKNVEQGLMYHYRLGDVAKNGEIKIHQPISVNSLALPTTTRLNKIYPNPFNPQSNISYQLAEEDDLKIMVYDLLGRRVRTLVDQKQKAGHYDIMWKGINDGGESVASGIYLVYLQSSNLKQVKRISLLR